MPSCKLCGSKVNVHGAVGVCEGCGAEYDVIKHGHERRDFAASAEVSFDLQKKPSAWEGPYLTDETGASVVGKVVYVGSIIKFSSKLYDPSNPYVLMGSVNASIWRRLGTATPTLLATVITDPYGNISYSFTPGNIGGQRYWIEWGGDAVYAGCESEGMSIRYASSQEVGVEVQASPGLTVVVKDAIFKKPIEGARVVIDTNEALTDALGTAVFETLEPGTYTVTVSAGDFKSETRTVDLTAAGMVVEVHLWHLGVIAGAIVGVGAVGVVAGVKLRRKK